MLPTTRQVFQYMDECAVAELADGRVYLNMRNNHRPGPPAARNRPSRSHSGSTVDRFCVVFFAWVRAAPHSQKRRLPARAGTKCHCRAYATSADGGASFGALAYDDALPSPVCQVATGGAIIFRPPWFHTENYERNIQGGV